MDMYTGMLSRIRSREGIERLNALYGSREGELAKQISRYSRIVKKHEELFHSAGKLALVSAPGRIEIAGNHTDHNNGRVLAAAVGPDCVAAVSPRGDMQVSVHSRGFAPLSIDLGDLSVREEEKGTSAALIRGVARGMADRGMKVGGYDAVVESDVVTGSGMSSSAAYEVMTAAILDHLFNASDMDPIERAKIAQYAENVYFGKPSGLMDQMASSVGGLVTIDFKEEPVVEPLSFRFGDKGYGIIVVNTGSSHDNLTDEYAAIRSEMNEVAGFFGKKVLRQVRPEEFWSSIPKVRKALGERPVMRAAHFFNENQRVKKLVRDIRNSDVEGVLRGISESGQSSQKYLQNVFVPGREQPLSLALMIAEHLLSGRGAWRVHGGGFAGTTLNIVPGELTREFTEKMKDVFGDECCFVLDIRPEGAALVLETAAE